VNREIESKTERVADLLDREKLGGVLLKSQHNFAWITAGAANGIDLSRENGAASVFIRNDGKRFLLANNIEMTRMLSEEVSETDFELIEYSWQDEKAGNLPIEKARGISSGVVATDIAMDASAPTIDGLLSRCRCELTTEEVGRYQRLGQDAGKGLRRVFDKIAPGERENDIASKLRTELAVDDIYPVVTLVAADERIENFRHPVATSNPWREKLLLVVCARRGGLIASLSRIACSGKVSDRLSEKTAAAAYVNAHLWSSTQPGISGAELYNVAARAYAECGFADEINKHHQGGACGYRTREWVAHPKSKERVAINQAFAWNPSITGTKVEETAILTEEGIQTITGSPDFPMIATKVNGREYRSPGILNIH
jgi:Xaa-Pro aminopeptidase